jgi:hypothetical protein
LVLFLLRAVAGWAPCAQCAYALHGRCWGRSGVLDVRAGAPGASLFDRSTSALTAD